MWDLGQIIAWLGRSLPVNVDYEDLGSGPVSPVSDMSLNHNLAERIKAFSPICPCVTHRSVLQHGTVKSHEMSYIPG